MPRRFLIGIFVVSALHSLVMIKLTTKFMNSPRVHWDDTEIAQAYSFVKKELLGIDVKPPQDRFLFIDVSNSKELIPKYDDYGNLIGNEDITDRAQLAKLFNVMNKYPLYDYALCDIRFWKTSPNDSLLKTSIEKTPKLMVSTHFSGDSIRKPIFDVDWTLSNYHAGTGSFFKYELFYNDSIKTTALSLYEALSGHTFENKGEYASSSDGNTYFNTFILDFRIRPYHYQENTTDSTIEPDDIPYRIPTIHINTFIEAAEVMAMIENDSFFIDNFKDRIVVIGDFEDRDVHSTIVGDMGGPVIIMNAYLALQFQDNMVNWKFFVYLFFGFFFISYLIFHPNDVIRYSIDTKVKFKLIKVILKAFNNVVFIALISFIGYLIFNFQISIMFLAMYVIVLNSIVNNVVYELIFPQYNPDPKVRAKAEERRNRRKKA